MGMDGGLSVGAEMLFTVGPNQHVNGTVKYIGPLQEDTSGEEWVGVELAEPVGRHSGRQYFACKPKHGLFVKAASALAASACSSEGRYVMPVAGPLFSQYLAGMQQAALAAAVELTEPPVEPIGSADALLLIDLQYDYLPGGAFATPEGGDTLRPLAGLLAAAAAAGAAVICTRDYHPADHASFNTQGGPFPPHCVQGSRGARLCAPIASALTAAKRAYPERVDVVFKGWHKHVDSFGAFTYPEGIAEGRLVQRQPPPGGVHPFSPLEWTGASLLVCSALHEDINAPPDVLAANERVTLSERLGRRRALFLAGMALDFCVLDSAITARDAGYAAVYIVLDVARPSHVAPIGFLTPPPDMLRKAHAAGVRFCNLADVFPPSTPLR